MSHHNKATKGRIVRGLLGEPKPRTVDDLGGALGAAGYRVELAPPAGEPARGRLGDGAVIPLARTNRNPQVEEVLGALSLLLNGGGVGELRGIVDELNTALQISSNAAMVCVSSPAQMFCGHLMTRCGVRLSSRNTDSERRPRRERCSCRSGMLSFSALSRGKEKFWSMQSARGEASSEK